MRDKLGRFRKDENHPLWKGEKASRESKHCWIYRNYGNANKCENINCNGISKKYEWANIKNHKYTRKIEDYKMMCRSCHTIFDRSEFCFNGHKRTFENTYIRSNGWRMCRICAHLTYKRRIDKENKYKI